MCQDMSYYFFMAEAEGLLPTRTGKINAVIHDMKDLSYHTIEFPEFAQILENHGLKYQQLTDKEIQRIINSIR